MAPPYPFNHFSHRALDEEQVLSYLERLRLPLHLLKQGPSYRLLDQLFIAHLERVAKDSSPLHVPEEDWLGDPEKDIILGSSFSGMPEGSSAFKRLVIQGRGAFCFGTNAVFAELLRSFGFRVSEVAARRLMNKDSDPLTHKDGWKWGTLTHVLLIVDWLGSEGRYYVDVGVGPGSLTHPIKLNPGGETIIRGLNDREAFRLVNEPLPLSDWMDHPIDSTPGYTFSQRITEAPLDGEDSARWPGFWSPLFHFLPISIPELDLRLYHHFSATHELAVFTSFFLISKLIPGTGGARRSILYRDMPGHFGRRLAKVYTTGGWAGKGSSERRDVAWVEMKIGPMRSILEKEFDYDFTL